MLLLLQCWDPVGEQEPPLFDPDDRRTNWEEGPRKKHGDVQNNERQTMEKEGVALLKQAGLHEGLSAFCLRTRVFTENRHTRNI